MVTAWTLTVEVEPERTSGELAGEIGDPERAVQLEFVGVRSSAARSFPKLFPSPKSEAKKAPAPTIEEVQGPVSTIEEVQDPCMKPYLDCIVLGCGPHGDENDACHTDCKKKMTTCCKATGRATSADHMGCAWRLN